MRSDANKIVGAGTRMWVVATVILTGLMTACAPRGKAIPRPDIVAVIDEVERAIVAGDFARAHESVDYRYRLDEMLGDLWRSGDDADRDDLERLTRRMFETTSESYLERFAGRPMERWLTSRSGPHLWVESGPRGDDGFVWRYRLTRRGTTWAITQREFRVSGAPSDSTRFWPMALKQLQNRFGRPLTLRELTANLPSVMGTLKARSIRIPSMNPPSQ